MYTNNHLKLMKLHLLLFFLFYVLVGNAQELLLGNAFNRNSVSLNGKWKYIIDPYENGFYNYRYEPFEKQTRPSTSAFFMNAKAKTKSDLVEYDFDKMDSITVPGDWNTQKKELLYYEGTVWYKKSFDYKKSKENNRVYVYFGGANYETDIYFNGKKLGKHIGGFTPFNFEVTELLKEKDNFLVVKVDNKRRKNAIPTLNTDWWNYGGITRDVKLIETAETFIQDVFIRLDPKNAKNITGDVVLKGSKKAGQNITIRIPELAITETYVADENGKLNFSITSNKIKYWSVKNPNLYEVTLSMGEDELSDQIGFRTIATKGSQILLNDKPIFLKGISIHEESPINGGRATNKKDAEQLLTWAKELGCNYVRLAHYPHNEYMIRLADKMGMLVWEENPVYWTISWENEDTFLNAKNQLSEVISRDKNRASVIIWSMANETPTSDARNRFLKGLAEYTRAMDDTRLISAALEQKDYQGNKFVRTIDDPFAKEVDILSFNQYIGWYDGGIEKCQKINWHLDFDKPVMISEFGAGAKYGLHAEKDSRWSEEYQEYLYQETIQMINKIDQLSGFSPWVLVDFRSPRRVLPEIQDGWNRKGLLSEKGEKKKAFHILREFYQSKK